MNSIVLEKKDNDILRRLNKTKEERQPDLRAEKEERDRAERQEQRKKQQEEVFILTYMTTASLISIV